MPADASLALAREALRLVPVDPGAAAELASSVSAASRAAGRWDAASVAERALGLASLHLHDLTVAHDHLRSAMSAGRRAGSRELVAEARMTFAFVLAREGHPVRGLAEVDAAAADLTGAARARAVAQRGAILQQVGRLDAAVADYQSALPVLRRAEDLVWVQRVLLNRGVLHAFRHEYLAARRDLLDAERVCTRLGLALPAAFVHENLGLVDRRLGDVPSALHHLDEAERIYTSVGAPIGSLLVERGEVLLSVRLLAEAREAVEQAVAELERAHRRIHTPEARLLLARVVALDGDPDLAVAEAQQAVRELRRQGRDEWVALARCILLLARLEGEHRASATTATLARAADAADAAGWPATAADVRLRAGEVGLAGTARDRARGREQLARVAASRSRGPADRRARGWLATALLRGDAGDRRGASAAARHGLRVIDDYRGTMAATDLRAGVSGHGVALARLGLRHALDGGSAREVLDWAERGRARHLLSRPALPPEDPEVAGLLAELRAVTTELAGDRRGVPALVRRQVSLERAVREATRRRLGSASSTAAGSPGPAVLADRLGDCALVEFVELDDTLHAVCVVGRRAVRRPLGPLAPVRDLVRWLPFALSRLARRPRVDASTDAATALVRHTASRLDELLLLPLERELADRPLVVVPTGVLQSLPWSLLPSVAGRALAVAPSTVLWHAAMGRRPAPGHVVSVAGPGLSAADREAVDVAGLYAAGPALVGAAATVGAVTASLSGAAVAHLAAHGAVRADNPLFSSLRLADGPLTVYDLERVDRGADTVVLAACEGGRDVVLAGDEMLGLGATFLAGATRHVVASVVPVPDAATAPLMVAFHSLLARGVAVAPALARAQQQVDEGDPAAFAASAGFICLGAGFDAIAPRRAVPGGRGRPVDLRSPDPPVP